LARSGWKIHLRESDGGDIESVLRIADMAIHYGAKPSAISEFLGAIASKKLKLSRSQDSEETRKRPPKCFGGL